MGAALALGERGRGRTAPNPNVGCVLVRGGRVVGRGWTQSGGRPHAEAVALAEAGTAASGATAYVTLEPCAHASPRGPACADLLIAAGIAHLVVALRDPDPRTDGRGSERLRKAGIAVTTDVRAPEARRAMAGFLTRQAYRRPHVTLKLAMSIDGCIALPDGRSQWITGPEARAHTHLERSRHEMILVGQRTLELDEPRLDVRLPGLERRAPQRIVLTEYLDDAPADWIGINAPGAILTDPFSGDYLLVEGGAGAASSFLSADLVDRLLIYRAPIVIGGGVTLSRIGLANLADAHGRWRLVDERRLGVDHLDVYERTRKGP